MRIAYDNQIDDLSASALTALTSDTNYPIENVQDQRLTTVWHSTALTAQTVIIDFGAAVSITTAAIMGHNITSAASVITVAGGTSASVFATAETLTFSEDMILKFFDAQSYRYWKFTVDNQGNADGYISIGRLWLGTYIQISPTSLDDFTVTKRRSDNVAYGRNRQKFASTGVGWREFELTFPKTGGSVLSNIISMYDDVGQHSSVIFCNFDSLTDYPLVLPCYCSIQEDLQFNHAGRQKYKWSLRLQEDK